MSKILRSNSIASSVMDRIFEMGTMWVSDLHVYMDSISNSRNSHRMTYDHLLTNGLIEEHHSITWSDIRQKNISKEELFGPPAPGTRSGYNVVNITSKGIGTLIDESPDDLSDYYRIHRSFVNRNFTTTVPENFFRELERTRVINLMSCGGVLALPGEKPSLYHLYAVLSGKTNYDPAVDNSEELKQYPQKGYDQIQQELQDGGYFYTTQEFRQFNEQMEPDSADPLSKTLAYGFFISHKACYMVYMSRPGDNRIISFQKSSTAEKYYKGRINLFFEDYVNYSKSYISLNRKQYGSDISCIVISDGNALVRSMSADENKAPGKSTGASLTQEYVLIHDNPLFQFIYVVPSNKLGLQHLDYLLTHSFREYLNESELLIKEGEQLFIPTGSLEAPFSYGLQKQPNKRGITNDVVLYLPVYEVNLLHELSRRTWINGKEEYDTYGIITMPEMVETLAKATGKNNIYYDLSSLKQIRFDRNFKEPVLLDAQEYEIVQKLIQANELLDRGPVYNLYQLELVRTGASILKAVSEPIPENIPKSLSKLRFIPEEVSEPEKDNAPVKSAKRRHRRKPPVNLTVNCITHDNSDLIRKAAKLSGKTLSQYMLDILLEKAPEDITRSKEAQKEQLRNMRARYK